MTRDLFNALPVERARFEIVRDGSGGDAAFSMAAEDRFGCLRGGGGGAQGAMFFRGAKVMRW